MIFIVFILFSSVISYSEELITLKTRHNVEQKYLLIKPKNPVASVILFSGGKGKLRLTSFLGIPSINESRGNFLVRSREIFSKNGFMVAVVDAPSDRQTKKGMKGRFRASKKHAQDIIM